MWKDEHGIDTLPLKLVVYLALVGIIIALTAIGLKNAGPPIDGVLIERQLEEVKSGIELMQTGQGHFRPARSNRQYQEF